MKLTDWEPFFSTLASVAATLAGLLFVALSLNLKLLMRSEQRLTKGLAIRCFTIYLYVIAMALLFLVPQAGARALALLLSVIGVVGLLDTVRFLSQTRRVAPAGELRHYFLRRVGWSFIDYVGMLGVAGAVWVGREASLHWLAVILVIMTMGTTLRAWDLMVRIHELALRSE
jgi:hypothetical protein